MKIVTIVLSTFLMFTLSVACYATEPSRLNLTLAENPELSAADAAELRDTLNRLAYTPAAIKSGNQDLLMNNLLLMIDFRSRLLVTYGDNAQREVAFLDRYIDASKKHFLFAAYAFHKNNPLFAERALHNKKTNTPKVNPVNDAEHRKD